MEIINSFSVPFLIDSLGVSKPTIEFITKLPEKSILEHIYSSTTLAISIVNLCLIIYIFLKNNKKNDTTYEKNRKINLLKTLVLDYNISKFYEFFSHVYSKAKLVNVANLSLEDKAKINDEINDLTTDFRQSFIDLFIAIDINLYNKILEKTDSLIDGITNSIFDEGVNLSHKPKFDVLIVEEIRKSKTEIIKIMFSYSG